MTSALHVLPGTELGQETFVPFCNDDDSAAHKDLTRPEVAEMAFASVFSDDFDQPEKDAVAVDKR